MNSMSRFPKFSRDVELPLFAGVDVGGTNIKIGLVDSAGSIVGSTKFPTRQELGPAHAIQQTRRVLEKFSMSCHIPGTTSLRWAWGHPVRWIFRRDDPDTFELASLAPFSDQARLRRPRKTGCICQRRCRRSLWRILGRCGQTGQYCPDHVGHRRRRGNHRQAHID